MWYPVFITALLSFFVCGSAHFPKIPGAVKSHQMLENVVSDINYLLSIKSLGNAEWSTLVVNNVTEEIVNAHFNKRAETKVIIHGWEGNCFQKDWFGYTMTKAYTDTKRYNVICVDWSRISNKSYPVARWDVVEVGSDVAQFLDDLVEAGIDPKSTHLLAHSLGAHVAGTAGSAVKHKIARITGLDPAGPLFIVPEKHMLNPRSADFVDVIHTCAHFKGLIAPLGHVDFYPNGGTYIQPGCGYDFPGSCSHGRCYHYFIESIDKPGSFIGLKCNEWKDFMENKCDEKRAEMGEHVDKSARGLFFLKTAENSPFGLKEDGIKPPYKK